jgi:hypothetical protein
MTGSLSDPDWFEKEVDGQVLLDSLLAIAGMLPPAGLTREFLRKVQLGEKPSREELKHVAQAIRAGLSNPSEKAEKRGAAILRALTARGPGGAVSALGQEIAFEYFWALHEGSTPTKAKEQTAILFNVDERTVQSHARKYRELKESVAMWYPVWTASC